jgi:hypothetical protein
MPRDHSFRFKQVVATIWWSAFLPALTTKKCSSFSNLVPGAQPSYLQTAG